MAKVNIKYEKTTPFGGIYYASKAFSSFIVFWFSTANLLYFCQKLVEVVKIKYFCSINGKLKLFGYEISYRHTRF